MKQKETVGEQLWTKHIYSSTIPYFNDFYINLFTSCLIRAYGHVQRIHSKSLVPLTYVKHFQFLYFFSS